MMSRYSGLGAASALMQTVSTGAPPADLAPYPPPPPPTAKPRVEDAHSGLLRRAFTLGSDTCGYYDGKSVPTSQHTCTEQRLSLTVIRPAVNLRRRLLELRVVR